MWPQLSLAIRRVGGEVARPGSSPDGAAWTPDAPAPLDPGGPAGLAVPGFGAGSPAGPAAGFPPGAMRGPLAGPPGRPRPAGSRPSGGRRAVVPEYCLIRVFDFTVEPGKTYEYGLQVRMANPNFGRKDVAAPENADKKELTAKEWYTVPEKATTPPELFFYAVDQAALDARQPRNADRDPKEPKLPVQPVHHDTQTVLQIQKWADYVPGHNGAELAVGDWVIAERVVATRGEPIMRQRAEVPYWRRQQDRFVMATDQPPPRPTDRKYVASIDVTAFVPHEGDQKAMVDVKMSNGIRTAGHFVPVGREPILVDVTGGDAAYARTHPPADGAPPPAAEPPVADKAPAEVLLLTADGRLLARSSAVDEVDPERVKRLEGGREWIGQVKHVKSGREDNPFGPPGARLP